MKYLLTLMMMSSVAGCGAHGITDTAHYPGQVQIGDQVPDFEVTLNGKQWKLSALRKESKLTGDGTIVLTFWCSVCHSCRDIERALDTLAKKYQGKAGVFA